MSPRAVSDPERGVNRTARQATAVQLAGALGLAEPARSLFVAAARGRIGAVFDPHLYTQRHRVECGINRLKRNRAVAHPLRQARRPLRSHPPRRRDQRMAPAPF